MAASAPEIVLATIAGCTKTIKLSSAVIVLSSADPVRTFQNFVTLDLVSMGRAELMVGRGSFTESFPLFGYSLSDYDDLFAEKLLLSMFYPPAHTHHDNGTHTSLGRRSTGEWFRWVTSNMIMVL